MSRPRMMIKVTGFQKPRKTVCLQTFFKIHTDPDATYRSKAGKSHKGYSANFVEAVDEKGSVVCYKHYV